MHIEIRTGIILSEKKEYEAGKKYKKLQHRHAMQKKGISRYPFLCFNCRNRLQEQREEKNRTRCRSGMPSDLHSRRQNQSELLQVFIKKSESGADKAMPDSDCILVVDPVGLEPMASALRTRRSPN